MKGRYLPGYLASAVAILIVGAVLLAGCGRKSSPKPPEATAPSPVNYLTAAGQVDAIVLTWQAPDSTASGDQLIDLDKFVVRRNVYQREESPDFEDVGEIKFLMSDEAEAVAQPDKPEPIKAKQYSFVDRHVEPGKQYEYQVIPVNESGVEGRSAATLRVTFSGESSYFETFSTSEEYGNPLEMDDSY